MSVIGSDAAETARKMYGLPPAGQSSGGGGGGGGGAAGGRMSGRIRTARHVADMPGSGRPTAPSFDNASDAGGVPDDAVSQASSHNPWKDLPNAPPVDKEILMAVIIHPPQEGSGRADSDTLVAELVRQANDPQSRLRNMPGMQDIISGVIVPPGFGSIDEVFKAYEEYEDGQKKKKEEEGEVPQKPPSVRRQNPLLAQDPAWTGGVNGPASGGGRGRKKAPAQPESNPRDVWQQQLLSAMAPPPSGGGQHPDGGDMTEAQRKAWAENAATAGGIGGGDGTKSMKMRIRTARDIADDAPFRAPGSEGSQEGDAPPWAQPGWGGVPADAPAPGSRGGRSSGPPSSSGSLGRQNWGKGNKVVATARDDPEVPPGFVKVMEPGGRVFFTKEEEMGIRASELHEEEGHVEVDSVTESSDEGGSDEESSDEEEEPIALTRLSHVFMRKLEKE